MKTCLLVLFVCVTLASGADPAPLCVDRTAVERVYFSHRLETGHSFEEAMPAPLIERLVKEDLRKEAALARIYGVRISDEALSAESARIEKTTRAPEVLAELKRALGDDPARFARAMVSPILVERILRDRFENDDALHAPRRGIVEALRNRLLQEADAAKRFDLIRTADQGLVQEWLRWELNPRPPAANPGTADQIMTNGSSTGVYHNEARVQFTAPPYPEGQPAGGGPKLYFENLPPDLQKVLRAQLCRPGDVSAVAETPGAFQLFLARECGSDSLTVAIFTVPKIDYDGWLAQQPDLK